VSELRFPAAALEDAVVRLRPWRESDVQSQLEAFSDPWFQRFSDWAPATAIEARRHQLEDEQARQRGERVQFALVEPSEDGGVLGGASLHDVELDQGRASVGFWLTADARGQGVATHAVRLIARWAFEDLGLERIVVTCAPDNLASQRVAERCGFSREGVLRSHMPFKGGRRDTVVFSVLPGRAALGLGVQGSEALIAPKRARTFLGIGGEHGLGTVDASRALRRAEPGPAGVARGREREVFGTDES
jgi:RimJ/RimL family protein N-acetyltransferase